MCIFVLAPENIKIVSFGRNGLKISWEQRNLPSDQKVIKHIITYRTGNEIKTKEVPEDKVYILKDLQYDKKYFISVQTITDIAGISDPSEVESITTNSGIKQIFFIYSTCCIKIEDISTKWINLLSKIQGKHNLAAEYRPHFTTLQGNKFSYVTDIITHPLQKFLTLA